LLDCQIWSSWIECLKNQYLNLLKSVSIINKEEYWQKQKNISDERIKANQFIHQNYGILEATEIILDRCKKDKENEA
jgi:hypothetical protein